MRVARFEQFLRQLVEGAGSDVIKSVSTFKAAGVEDPPYGLVLEAANGARLYLHPVGTSPDGGDDWRQPERPAVETDAPLDRVDQPELSLVGGKLRVADVDDWLRALVVNSGSREVSEVRLIAENPSYHHSRGLKLRFHSGATITCMWRHTVPAGGRPAEEFKVTEAI